VILARYTEIIRDAQQRSEKLFNLKPAAPVEVRREPALTERTAAAHYTAPAVDGSRPGIFRAPLPGAVSALTPRMRSLAYHEAVPGHHFQIALQQEQKQLPRFRARRSSGHQCAQRGLGALRRAARRGRKDGTRATGPVCWGLGLRTVPRPPTGGGHGSAHEALDPSAGDRLRNPGE
jgi:hypothetical protein